MKANILGLFLIGLLFITGCALMSPPEEGNALQQINLENVPKNIDVETASQMLDHEDVVLIDVREQWEYEGQHIKGATLIPMSEIEERLAEIPTDKTVILTCRSGHRSGEIFSYLEERGYDNTINMEGGILAWEAAGLAVEE